MLPTWLWLLFVLLMLIAAFAMAYFAFGLSASTLPVDPIIAFGVSPCLSPAALHRFRIISGVLMFVLFVYDLYSKWQSGYWYIYLTHWALFIETVYMVMLGIVSKSMLERFEKNGQSFAQLRQCGRNTEVITEVIETRICQIYMILQSTTLPLCLLITIIYWTALNPIWKMCPFDDHAKGCVPFPTGDSVFVHFFNTVLIFVVFLCGNIPFEAKNGGWIMIFCGVYGIWTIIQFFFKIGTGDTCSDYPPDECPIYPIIDWHKPGQTLVIIAGLTFVLAPLVDYACIGICKARGEKFRISCPRQADVKEVVEDTAAAVDV